MLWKLILIVTALSGHPALGEAPISTIPKIINLLKPETYKRVLEEDEIAAYASLDQDLYRFYTAMRVKVGIKLTRVLLTDYRLYAKMIRYVERAEYSPTTHILDIVGGIWKFRLSSSVLFEERSPDLIRFEIVRGHFDRLKGNLIFEDLGEKGTLVAIQGSRKSQEWPPKFVMERGAEIVFRYAAHRMRSYVESQKRERIVEEVKKTHGGKNEQEVPKPRTRL